MQRLEIKIGDEKHRVVYIDYNDGIPHQVNTITFISFADKPYWRLYTWDFFANNGDKTDIRAYKSGSGGSHKQIQAPKYRDGYTGKYWIASDAKFTGKTKSAKRLKNPLRIADYSGNKSINPFKVSEITDSIEWCDRCGHHSTEFCYKHKYDDAKGHARYKDDDSAAE